MAPKLEDHLDRIMGQLAYGRTILEQLPYAIQEPYHVPDVVLNYELTNKSPPLEGDLYVSYYLLIPVIYLCSVSILPLMRGAQRGFNIFENTRPYYLTTL